MKDCYEWDRYHQKSWSQEGEDLILARYFGPQKSGFYIDIGAHHPLRFSNTYKFYKRGWNGINIDAMPGSMKAFERLRKRDVNLEIPVSDQNETLLFYIFNDSALNSFDSLLSEERDKEQNEYRIIDKVWVETKKLSKILDEYLPRGRNIDFLTIDIEGFDFKAIKSNDWEKYRPRLLLVERLRRSSGDADKDELLDYLSNTGYEAYARTVNTLFFRRVID